MYKDFLNELGDDPNILGVILAGSRARGLQNDHSDYDIYIVFKNEISPEVIKEYDKRLNDKYGESMNLDISNKALMTLAEFAHYAELGSDYYYDRYNLVHSKMEIDRSEGEIAKLLHKIETLSPDEQKLIIRDDLGEFISLVYQSMKSREAGRVVASTLDAAESVRFLLSSVFALHNRVRPYNKYLEWELTNYPLSEIPWEPQEFLSVLSKIVKETDLKTLQTVYMGIEVLARKKGLGHKYDDWGKKLKYVNRKTFDDKS